MVEKGGGEEIQKGWLHQDTDLLRMLSRSTSCFGDDAGTSAKTSLGISEDALLPMGFSFLSSGHREDKWPPEPSISMSTVADRLNF